MLHGSKNLERPLTRRRNKLLAEVAARHQSVVGPPDAKFKKIAEVAELAYAQVSEACPERVKGSTPFFRTNLLSS